MSRVEKSSKESKKQKKNRPPERKAISTNILIAVWMVTFALWCVVAIIAIWLKVRLNGG